MELPLAATAEATWEAEKEGGPAARTFSFRNSRLRIRVAGSEAWGTIEVNCLFSRLAIFVYWLNVVQARNTLTVFVGFTQFVSLDRA